MKLTVVGSSDAFNAMGRFHSCYLLEGDGFGTVMIDFGATALAGLRKLGREPTELAGIAVTHLHGDHIGGLPFLFIDGMYHAVRRAQLPIVGPVGTRKRVKQVVRAAYGKLADEKKPFDVKITEIEPGQSASLAGLTVLGFPAEHMDPPDKPLCLRMTAPDGRSVAFSGDTEMCQGLLDAAHGVDLLVAECSGLEPPIGRHTTWQDWERTLPYIGAKRVLLSHLGTAVREKADQLLRELDADVQVEFADDGMELEIGR